ncbi:MAG: 7-cyano-7-deazaguanine synthase QueC [Candidatus Saliniplasma sp.]
MSKAVVLLSGGLDSSTTLAVADKEHDDIFAITFRYGQKHDKEIRSSKKLAEHYDVEKHIILDIPLEEIARSSLLEGGEEIPDTKKGDIGQSIPTTYVPARNIIFLSYALSYAESVDAQAIYIGATAVDYSGYPDCRPEFFDAFKDMAKKGTKKGVEGNQIDIITPLIDKSKAEIIERGTELSVPFEKTWSCYRGGTKACGTCDSCRLRLKGFEEAGITDPLIYE